MASVKFRVKAPSNKPCKQKGCVCRKKDGRCDQKSVNKLGVECVSFVNESDMAEMEGRTWGLE